MGEILIASDHAGFELKKNLIMNSKINKVFKDLGAFSSNSVDYPDYANKLSLLIHNKKFEKGVLICGSGIGMSMVANRYSQVRAALCMNSEMSKLARQHNNANILVLGSRLISLEDAIKCLLTFINTNYEGGRHQARLDKFNLVR
ncbi:MAG: ribose 5-phosphate isomerase B [Pelagibacteraceae bacterium TMED65]|nr:ribose 5-phosphate isomerase B [Rickettsiales bacterium]OUU52784.1 MAG: ribose 5-phosphate isomerase B [Pelagibacteraceae bacterium TMED65]